LGRGLALVSNGPVGALPKVNLKSVADELCALPREQFTAARNAAASRARGQGHRELAEEISELRRPTTAAWLVNVLAREQPGEVRALVELGDGLRAAQRQLHGEELRRPRSPGSAAAGARPATPLRPGTT
jgi:hypothetical protein